MPRDGRVAGRTHGARPVDRQRLLQNRRLAAARTVGFRTGDIATIDSDGVMQIRDRAKDLIKTGGEWISSIDLENTAIGHPCVAAGGRHRRQASEVAGTPAAVRGSQARARAASPRRSWSFSRERVAKLVGARSRSYSWNRCRSAAPARYRRRHCEKNTEIFSTNLEVTR